jgi:hypothetical protein
MMYNAKIGGPGTETRFMNRRQRSVQKKAATAKTGERARNVKELQPIAIKGSGVIEPDAKQQQATDYHG